MFNWKVYTTTVLYAQTLIKESLRHHSKCFAGSSHQQVLLNNLLLSVALIRFGGII